MTIRPHVVLLIMLVSISWASTIDADTLYVFVPTEVRPNVMQKDINSICPEITVTVFGRAKDFRTQVSETSPSAILTLLPVIERSAEYTTVLKGARSGATEEDYVIVSVGKPLNFADLNGKRLGVVDLLGRKPMNEFIEQLLQTKIKVKRVTRVEDLLPLLNFKAVDGLFIADSLFQSLKAKSNLELVATHLDIKVGLVSAALNTSEKTNKAVDCITKFSGELNKIVGVEKWQSL